MPLLETSHNALRCFSFHGLDIPATSVGGGQRVIECPWCGKSKLYIQEAEGLWECKVCGLSGNPLTFLRHLHEHSPCPEEAIQELATERKLVSWETLAAWGVVKSGISGEWLVPGYNVAGEVHNLYRYVSYKDSKGEWRKSLMPSPGVHGDGHAHGIFGVIGSGDGADALIDPSKDTLYITEGPWDGMALWELVKDEANVLAVPGANVFRRVWLPLFQGMKVVLLFDSDHPKELKNGQVSPSTGYTGMKSTAKVLLGLRDKEAPAAVSYIHWGDDGYHPDLTDGVDVRDVLSAYGDTPKERLQGLNWLLEQVQPVPDSWKEEAQKEKVLPAKVLELKPIPCDSWEAVVGAWSHKGFRWRRDIEDVLAVMIAVTVSTELTGDQLFLQVIGEPGSAKTRLCDAMLVSKRCFALEHLTGFHSGYQGTAEDRENKVDFSLLSRCNRKTLITPEGDVMMSSKNFDEIMSQQRRIFDGTSGASYKNRAEDIRWTGLRTPWILAGTPKMLNKEQSGLGDRFLKVYVDQPGEKEKRSILMAVARSAWNSAGVISNGTAETSLPAGMARAYGMTGGYIDHLGVGLEARLAGVRVDEEQLYYISEYCSTLADFVADFRARPNPDMRKDSEGTKELPSRVTSQLIRLSRCLAVVLGKTVIDDEVLRIVKKVAVDTSRGRSLDIATYLYSVAEGCEERALPAFVAGVPTKEKAVYWLTFMKRLGIVTPNQQEIIPGVKVPWVKTRWKLTPRARGLFAAVLYPGGVSG